MIDISRLDIVVNPNIYTDNSMENIEENGLMSERIFGPIKNYKCACGFYTSKTQHGGQRCPKCKVLCDSSELRCTTFAKIILPLPIFKPTSKNKTKLRYIVGSSGRHLLDPTQSDLSRKTKHYLYYNPERDKLRLVEYYDPETCIPLRIIGIYTLYIAILACMNIYKSKNATFLINNVFTYTILVTPPATRIYFIQNKEGVQIKRKHPLNDMYSQILKLCSYDWTHIMDPNRNEQMYVDMIKLTIGNPLEIVDDDLHYWDQLICRYQYYTNKIYDNIIASLSGKDGYIRKDFLGRSVDFSSRSQIICNPALKSYEIKIPKDNFMRLWFIEFMKYMIEYKNIDFDEIRHYAKITENDIMGKYPEYIDQFIDYIFSEKTDYRNRIVLTNRQPTLWKYGIPASLIIGISKGDVIEVGPLFLEAINADFDGD